MESPVVSEDRPARAGRWSEAALRVLRERYLFRDRGEVVETPEEMCWRVARAIAASEERFGRSPLIETPRDSITCVTGIGISLRGSKPALNARMPPPEYEFRIASDIRLRAPLSRHRNSTSLGRCAALNVNNWASLVGGLPHRSAILGPCRAARGKDPPAVAAKS